MGRDKGELRKYDQPKPLFSRDGSGNTGTGFPWKDVKCESLAELIAFVTERGGAIRFGCTRDGGAGAVGVYYGDSRGTVYIRPGEDVDMAFQGIYQELRDKPITGGKSVG